MDEIDISKIVLSAVAKTGIDRILKRVSKRTDLPIRADLVASRLQAQARQISSVKTLLSTETHVSIEDFFCPPRVTVGIKQFVPDSSKDFQHDQILIEGVAGQGKSILLRQLCANAITKHGKIAFFYELRRIDPFKPIVSILKESLEDIGLPANAEALKSLTVERDVEIYLDGFDEVDQKTAEKIDRDVNYLATNYPFIKLFVSARPHAGLAKNPTFVTYRIEDLNKQDVFRLVEKLCRDRAQATTLKTKLTEHKGNAVDLLETPLLVTLLVAQYIQTQQIPEQLAEFYDSIFLLLFERHDTFKAPFIRKKRLQITTQSYRRVFQQFCFGSLFATTLTDDRAAQIATWAIMAQNVQAQPHDFLNDVSDVSSLINGDAKIWTFIHNSVQEYYAAAFILSGTDSELAIYAKQLVQTSNAASREQVFRFANEIDGFRFIKFVETPFYERLTHPLPADSSLSPEDCLTWLLGHVRNAVRDKNTVQSGFFFSLYTDCVGEHPFRLYSPPELETAVTAALAETTIENKIAALAEIPIVRSRMIAETKSRIAPYLAKRVEHAEVVKNREKSLEQNDEFLNTLLAGGAT